MNIFKKLKYLGKTNLALQIAAINLQDLIKEFIKEDKFYKYYKSANDFYGKCDGIANDFYSFLTNKGLKNTSIITGIGYLKDLSKEAAEYAKKQELEFLTHVVVRVGNKVVDLTGKQFGENSVRIVPFSTFKKEWTKIKKGPYWKISTVIEGIASRGYVTIGKGNNTLYVNTPSIKKEVTFVIVKSFNSYFVLSTKRKARGNGFDITLVNNTYESYHKDALSTIRYLAVLAGQHDLLKYFKENLSPKEFTKLLLTKEDFYLETFNKWFPDLKQVEEEEEESIYKFKVIYDDAIKPAEKDKIIDFIHKGSSYLEKFGLSGLLYGKVFVVDKLKGNRIAAYNRTSDIVKVSRRAAKKYNPDMGRNFIHELGHRLWTKKNVKEGAVNSLYRQAKYGLIEEDLKIGDVFEDKQSRKVEIKDIRKERGFTYYDILVDGKEQHTPSGAFKYMKKIKGKPMTDPELWRPSPYAMAKNSEEYFCEMLAYGLVDNNKLYKDFIKKVIT